MRRNDGRARGGGGVPPGPLTGSAWNETFFQHEMGSACHLALRHSRHVFLLDGFIWIGWSGPPPGSRQKMNSCARCCCTSRRMTVFLWRTGRGLPFVIDQGAPHIRRYLGDRQARSDWQAPSGSEAHNPSIASLGHRYPLLIKMFRAVKRRHEPAVLRYPGTERTGCASHPCDL